MKIVMTEGFKEDMNQLFSNEFKYVLRRWWIFISYDMWQELKWFFQRGKLGYADNDCWGTDSYLSKVIPAMLEVMINKKKHGGNSYPGYGKGGETYKDWHITIKKIIKGFNSFAKLGDEMIAWDSPRGKKLAAEYKEGMRLFVKWFPHLWD